MTTERKVASRDNVQVHSASLALGEVTSAPLVNRSLDGIEPDFRWPAHEVIVELDGFETHGTRRAFERDRRLQATGWRVVRVTWRQLHEDRTELAPDLHSLLPRLSEST